MSKFSNTAWLLSGAFVLVFLLTSCLKQDNILGELRSNGSSAELNFNGRTHKVSGVGLANLVDTLINSNNNEAREVNLLGLSVSEYNGGFLAFKYFSIVIYGYTGPGKYLPVILDDEGELSGVFGFMMYTGDGASSGLALGDSYLEELEVIIDRDNNTQISGTFSGVGENEATGVVGPYTGKFKVIK